MSCGRDEILTTAQARLELLERELESRDLAFASIDNLMEVAELPFVPKE